MCHELKAARNIVHDIFVIEKKNTSLVGLELENGWRERDI